MTRPNFAKDALKQYIEKVERLEEEKRAVQDDIKGIFAEAKGQGFDPKIMRLVLRERRLDQGTKDERDALLDLYLSALVVEPSHD